jgi:hypothetical protein
MKRLSRQHILTALNALSVELTQSSEPCEVFVVGGAAVVLLYDARESTKDVDAFTLASSRKAELAKAADRVADLFDLPRDWLNDAAKGFVHGLSPGQMILDTPTLRVRALSTAQLLAMKISAWRDDIDIEDANLLLGHLAGNKHEVWAQLEPHIVPGREMKAHYAFEDLWEAKHGSD